MNRENKSWLTLVVVGFVVSLLLLSCASNQEIQAVSPTAHLVDVRTPGEFAAGHYPGAENIPLDQIEKDPSIMGEKGQEIIVYCRSGRRSGIAKEKLQKAGYTNVKNGGGLKEMCKTSKKC